MERSIIYKAPFFLFSFFLLLLLLKTGLVLKLQKPTAVAFFVIENSRNYFPAQFI
jgi:hypothetical protein